MNEYLFLLGPGHLPRSAARIAEKHGATLVNYTDPQCKCGHGCAPSSCPASRRHWFAAANRGEPFNRTLSATLSTALAAATLGRKGGAVKSQAKATAAKTNGAKGGRPLAVGIGQTVSKQCPYCANIARFTRMELDSWACSRCHSLCSSAALRRVN